MTTNIRRAVAFFLTHSPTIILILCAAAPVCGALQETDENTSSRREAEAIKAIEDAGGRVYKISAADESREISCYLSSTPIKDQHLKNISAISNVIWLNLANSEVTNDGLKCLAGMPLTKLHLEKTQIGDEGLQHLQSFDKLEYLNLYGTKVTDAGLQQLTGLKNLKRLYVWQTGVTDAGIKKLNESLPELEIVGEVKLIPAVVEEPKSDEQKGDAKTAGDKKDDAKKDESKTDKDDKAKQAEGETDKNDAGNKPTGKKARKKKDQSKTPGNKSGQDTSDNRK